MDSSRSSSWTQSPWEVLGLPPDADSEAVRAAYLRKVKEFPPDRSPERFERVREAYEVLSDPMARAGLVLFANGPGLPLADVLVRREQDSRFVGPDPWLRILKDKRR